MITAEMIVQIRAESRKGPGGRGGTGNGATIAQLAEKYGTTYRNMRAILDGETWCTGYQDYLDDLENDYWRDL